MALSLEQLQKIKSRRSNNTVNKLGRIRLENVLSKFAGKQAEYDEFTSQDRVPFVMYWDKTLQQQFMSLISDNHNIDKKIAKDLYDNLFKYSKNGECLIYASRRTPLPESVTYDENSKYVLIVDLLHAKGTDKDGKAFENYYTKVLDVKPQTDKENQFLTFSDDEVLQIQLGDSVGDASVPEKIEEKTQN